MQRNSDRWSSRCCCCSVRRPAGAGRGRRSPRRPTAQLQPGNGHRDTGRDRHLDEHGRLSQRPFRRRVVPAAADRVDQSAWSGVAVLRRARQLHATTATRTELRRHDGNGERDRAGAGPAADRRRGSRRASPVSEPGARTPVHAPASDASRSAFAAWSKRTGALGRGSTSTASSCRSAGRSIDGRRRHTAVIDMRGLPRGTYSGRDHGHYDETARVLRGSRTYRTCAGKLRPGAADASRALSRGASRPARR